MDYSGYVIERFGAFETENPRLAAKFVRTVDAAYSNFSWMKDDAFRQAISDALDDFFGTAKRYLLIEPAGYHLWKPSGFLRPQL